MPKIGEDEQIVKKNPKKEKPVNLVDEETLERFTAPIIDHSAELAALDPAMAKVHINLRAK